MTAERQGADEENDRSHAPEIRTDRGRFRGMGHAWFTLALVACHSDAASQDPAQKAAAWCHKVDDLFARVPGPIDRMKQAVAIGSSPENACELARRESAGLLHGFVIGMEAPDLKTFDAFTDAARDLEIALDDALGPGCSHATGGTVDLATSKARAAIDHARAAISACPR